MANKTKIEWTDRTWNPVSGCTKVSPGCANCYAERITNRFAGAGAFDTVLVKPHKLDEPLHWRKPCRVFVNSMSDLFHEDVPDNFIDQVFAVMAMSPHTYQILTKRPCRMRAYLATALLQGTPWPRGGFGIQRIDGAIWMVAPYVRTKMKNSWPLPNVWLGVSVESQHFVDERISILLETPAAVRFVSYEPALGPVDFTPFLASPVTSLDWLICGGESGPHARPMHPDWARAARDQCAAAGVPFFFKQWGELLHVSIMPAVFTDDEMEVKTFRAVPPSVNLPGRYFYVGKKRAGRLLDGEEYNEFPCAPSVRVDEVPRSAN